MTEIALNPPLSRVGEETVVLLRHTLTSRESIILRKRENIEPTRTFPGVSQFGGIGFRGDAGKIREEKGGQ
jgi:midasin (ATPase involved in ribosome maturation)